MVTETDRALDVLVVEDLDEPREWLLDVLQATRMPIARLDTAATRVEAESLAHAHHYDLALVDWTLPDGTAEETVRVLSAQSPPARVIITTIHDDDAHVFPALRAGAWGYLLKSQPRAVVVAQLGRIQQDEPPLSPSIARRLLAHFHQGVSTPVHPVHLSDRETEILQLVGKGYRSNEVANLLGITLNTVNSYVRDVYRKLGISSRAEAAAEAARRGLLRF